MTVVPMALNPSFGMALGLTALLAASAGKQPVVRERRSSPMPLWFPVTVLIVLGLASCVFAILHPEAFVIAGGEGMSGPADIRADLAQF